MHLKWVEIKVQCNPAILEELSSYLFALGSDGLVEDAKGFVVYFPREVWSPESLTLLQTMLKSRDSAAEINLSEIEAQNWNEKWKENFKPFSLTENCVIVPDWEKDFDTKGAHKIIISPKMAFGTGHHETTQLILMLLPQYLKPTDRVMDAGTGSAILAIHAMQLGARSVFAFDNDPVAMENACENVQQNGFEDQIETVTTTPDEINSGQYDLILANINRNVLLDLADTFIRFAGSGIKLILSGLLKTDFEKVNSTYSEHGWHLMEQKSRGEWLALVYDRN